MPLPVYTFYKEASQIPSSLVQELRDLFLDEVAKTPDKFYQQDIDRIKDTDWPLQRYLLIKKNNVNEALECLVGAMKWRKSFGVRDIKESDFPQELFRSGYSNVYCKDLNGAQVVVIRGKCNKKSKTWLPTIQRYSIFQLEKVDRENTGKGLTTLFDCRGTGLKNVELNLVNFGFKTMREYYPGLGAAILVHKLPSVLEPVFKTVLTMLNEEEKKRICLTKKKNINEFIANDQLPDFFGGSNTKSYRNVPEDAPTAEQLAKKLGIKEGKGDKLAKFYSNYYID